MFSYAEFDKVDENDRYRMMDIDHRGNNRDGAAIQFVCERLLAQPENAKILFIVCDGDPYAFGYSGQLANDDITAIVEHYGKYGIKFFTLAIGDDKEKIKEIYGNRFVDITDLAELPERLADLMKTELQNIA